MNSSDLENLDMHGFAALGSHECESRDGVWSISVTLLDTDSYQWLRVVRPAERVQPMEMHGMTPDEAQACIEALDKQDPDRDLKSIAATCRLVRPLMDHLPPDVVALEFDRSGALRWTSTKAEHNPAASTYYPSVFEYRLRRPLATVLRSHLTVVGRLRIGVDKVVLSPQGAASSPGDTDKAAMAFKYTPEATGWGGQWGEIQIMAQFPRNHPHLLQLDSLVVEETSGLGVTLDKLDPPRPFKLRWLRELMAVVDELNLEFGIVHQDIVARNLMINPATDSILLFDFGFATGVGYDGPMPYRRPTAAANDVKAVVILAYYLVTRDARYEFYNLPLVDEKEVDDRAKWVNPAGVELDHDASVFYDVVTGWAAKRRGGKQITHYTQAPRHFDLPTAPDPPRDIVVDENGVERHLISVHGCVSSRIKAGRPVLSWQRPPASKVDKNRRLLATGRYMDEEKDGPGIAVPDSKRGFPQPPVPASVAVKTGPDNAAKKAKRRKRRYRD